jgi:hypothetical protein
MAEDLDHQLAETAALVAYRLEAGDQADVPRQVDHLAYFKKANADAAAQDLTAAGFTVAAMHRKLLKVGIEFHRIDPCDRLSASNFTREIIAIVNNHDGSYDGWASFLSK